MQNQEPFRFSEEPTYDPKEQEAILSLAARLQSDAAHGCTLAELEHTAAISGIDPRFVREAARRIEVRETTPRTHFIPTEPGLDRRMARRALTLTLVFLPVQLILMSQMLMPIQMTPYIALGLAMATLLGIAMPSGLRWRAAAGALIVVGTFAAILFSYYTRTWMRPYLSPSAAIVLALAQAGLAYGLHAINDRMQTVREQQRRFIA